MNSENAIVTLNIPEKNFKTDIEIPLKISANELVIALNTAYNLEINTTDIKNCYLKAENPIGLLKGDKTLEEFGIRNGSVINYRK